MYKGFLHTHYLVVTLFLLIYVVKTILLLSNKNDLLAAFTKKVKVFEMIVSALFLITGVYLLSNLSFGQKYDYLLWIKLTMVGLSIPIAIVGFKKNNKILAALSLLLITGSFGMAEVRKKKTKTPEMNNDLITEAKALYQNNCSSCHGNDGKLQSRNAADLTKTLLNTEQIKTVILNGKGQMEKVSVNEIQAGAIADYVFNSIRMNTNSSLNHPERTSVNLTCLNLPGH